MAYLLLAERKGSVLTRPSLGCLARCHTINLTAGCPYECRYCYAQGFRSHPGKGKVKFYANSLEALRLQLPRKRKPPELVYFSTACEPFTPFQETQDCLYGCMRLLLEAGSNILVSTKAGVPRRFVELFAAHPGKVRVQVGLTTVDDTLRRLMEPEAEPVRVRLATMELLVRAGVDCEVRADPLIPELTDTVERFDETMCAAENAGVVGGVVSYVFLRRANMARLSVKHLGWDFRETAARIFDQAIESYCGGGRVRIPSGEYRLRKYEELRIIARSHRIRLRLCGCKNPDLTEECCHPLPKRREGDVGEQDLRLTGNLFESLREPDEQRVSS